MAGVLHRGDGGDSVIRVEKPNFRSPLIEADSNRILDPYWQRILLRQADAINALSEEVEKLKQYNIDHP